MRKNKNILKKGMILAAVSTMVVTMAPAIPAYAYGEADSKTGQAAFNAARIMPFFSMFLFFLIFSSTKIS